VIVCERCGRDGLLHVVRNGEGRVIGGDVKPDLSSDGYSQDYMSALSRASNAWRHADHREEIEDEVLRGEHRDD
jgi:hypothetical protein